MLKKISLRKITAEVLKKNRKVLLKKKICVQCHDLEEEVYSDSKWMAFILQQILSNSVKYIGEGEKILEWYARKEKEQVKLYLKDTGIGIPARDLPRVWEKGFTGENGRTEKNLPGSDCISAESFVKKWDTGLKLFQLQGREAL